MARLARAEVFDPEKEQKCQESLFCFCPEIRIPIAPGGLPH